MSTTVNAYNSAASAGVLQSAGTLSSSTAPRVKADAEIIAQVMTAEIKPSNINEVSQPTREAVAKAAADLQQFVQSVFFQTSHGRHLCSRRLIYSDKKSHH